MLIEFYISLMGKFQNRLVDMRKALLHLVYRNYTYKKGRSLLFLLGIIITVVILTIIISSTNVMVNYFEKQRIEIYGDYDILINHINQTEIKKDLDNNIKNLGTIYSYGDYEIQRNEGPSIKGKIGAFDSQAISMAHIKFIFGGLPTKMDEIAIEQSIYLKLSLEDKSINNIDISITDKNGEKKIINYKITGVYRDISDVWTNIDQSQYILPSILSIVNDNTSDSAILIKFNNNVNISNCVQKLSSIPNGGFFENEMLLNNDEQNNIYKRQIMQFGIVISILVFVSMLICSIQSIKAMLSTRKKQYDILSNIGIRREIIIKLSIIEVAFSYLLCVPISILIGYILSYLTIKIACSILKSNVPFYVSWLALVIVIILSLITISTAWIISIRKRKVTKSYKKEKKYHMNSIIKRAVIGQSKDIHIAAIGTTIACICFLFMPLLTRYFSIYSIYPAMDYLNRQEGDYFIYGPLQGCSSLLYVPDDTNAGMEYTDLKELENIPQVKNVFYYYEMDDAKIIIDNNSWLNNKAIQGSLLDESNFGQMASKQEIETNERSNGYITNGIIDNLAIGTVSGVDDSTLITLGKKLINGNIDLNKLDTGEGVLVVDVSDISGDENMFNVGDKIDMSELTWNRTENNLDSLNRNDANVTIVGTVTLSKEELSKYFNPSYTYADLFLNGLGIRFIWGSSSFDEIKMPAKIQYTAVTLKNPYDYNEVQAFTDRIEKEYPGITVVSKTSANQLVLGLNAIIIYISILLSISIFITGLLSWSFALYSNILIRGKEHGIIKAIGSSNKYLSSVYIDFGMNINFKYSIGSIITTIIIYILLVLSNTGDFQYFWQYASSFGLWYRAALCIVVQTVVTSLLSKWLFWHNNRSINEEIRYE